MRCLKDKMNRTYNDVEHTSGFLCHACVDTILPFQNLNDEMFNQEIENISLHQFLSNINNKIVEVTQDDYFFDENIKLDKYYFGDDIKNAFCKNSRELTILHVNIVSLITNFSKLEELLCIMTIAPDVICLSESRLKEFHN